MNHSLKLILLVSLTLISVSLLEALVLSWRGRHGRGEPFNWSEAWVSLADMAGRRLLALMPYSLAAPVFAFVWQHRIFTVSLHSMPMLFLLFIGQEFCYYWYHRTSHRVRFFWATHAVHHSPNQLTLSTAYRLGWTSKLTGSLFFFLPLTWLGVRPEVVYMTLTVNLWYQFWLHTTWIPKLGWLEYVFNTPSAHRVHHASNVEYLDVNYGGVLIVFDRLFGTYREERSDLPCRYGLVTPTRTSNPLKVEFEHWVSLVRDVVSAKNLWAAINYIIRPPGWLPDGKGETTEDPQRRVGLAPSRQQVAPKGAAVKA
jgi:sterol desaturase/sphingolipid hydroxylase (fatty acid hydroxylase superfamily)